MSYLAECKHPVRISVNLHHKTWAYTIMQYYIDRILDRSAALSPYFIQVRQGAPVKHR